MNGNTDTSSASSKKSFIYKGNRTGEISFPLGGIGTGCVGLSGNGRLIDWEIFNRPAKGTANGFTHFAIKAESDGALIDARVLQGDLAAPYTGKHTAALFRGYGFGPDRDTLAGIPHFKETEFIGEFPFATLRMKDNSFPGEVSVTAFNPFIPLNERDSSIPAAFFEIAVRNTSAKTLRITVAGSLQNTHSAGLNRHRYGEEAGKRRYIHLGSDLYDPQDVRSGDLCLAAEADEISFQEYWYRGTWFDNLETYWKDFTAPGPFQNRSYAQKDLSGERRPQSADTATLAVHMTLQPGEEKKARFILSWNFPNCSNYWNPPAKTQEECTDILKGQWKNYYATIFRDSVHSAMYGLEQWNRLFRETTMFKEALFQSSIPDEAIGAVSANISILKTPTCLRLEDGSFYGFEGCHCSGGCCEGSCTHVWNYAYALPFLFPRLERSMRDLDFTYNQREDGGMGFRLNLPPGRRWEHQFRPCADGQFGGVIKAYRDWKISGDSDWLRGHWEAIKKSIEYAWAESNEDGWDADRDGVLEGRQHHTLDMELFGPNAWLTGFYLAALKAGAEMAAAMGDQNCAREFNELFMKGKEWVDRELFNGEYFFQKIDLNDPAILRRYDKGDSIIGGDAMTTYWNAEAGEIKYQIAQGCGVDQVLAQWHANLCGLGNIFDPQKVRLALRSIYHYNFKKNMRMHFNPCRLYALNDEAGLVICGWPANKPRPHIPVVYSEECMNGFEYQAAVHMIQEGMQKEGLEIVRSVRDRYDGEKRNPWNEFECGNNYARSMASYALIPAFSGFEYDLTKGMIGFCPIDADKEHFSHFWSLDCGWGTFAGNREVTHLTVLYGNLRIGVLKCSLPGRVLAKASIHLSSGEICEVSFQREGSLIRFTFEKDQMITIEEGNHLRLEWHALTISGV